MFIVASICYSFSIFIDVFAYHLKYNIHSKDNMRYIFSLINVFQFSARGFVLIFAPVMAYYTETVKSISIVWYAILFAHIFVVLSLLPLYNRSFSFVLSKKIFFILNFFLRSAKNVELEVLNSQIEYKEGFFKKVGFVSIAYVSGFFFSFSTTFLYYLSFYYPDKILTLVSYSQILNMVGAMLLLLLIDPKLMSSIDKGVGSVELKLLTTSRILVHVTLIIILLFIKWI